MTVPSVQSPDPQPVRQPADSYHTDSDAQARKRMAIGLAPHRTTAPAAVQRPPQPGLRLSQWWLAFCVLLLIIAVSVLAVAFTLTPETTWSELWQRFAVRPWLSTTEPSGYHLWLQEDFTAPSPYVGDLTQPGAMAAAVLPAAGVYRMDVWPANLGWSRLDTRSLPSYRLESTVTVDASTPMAAAGLMARFKDDASFYLFVIDGQGRFGAYRWQTGRSEVLQTPIVSPALRPAGTANRLVVEDTGGNLRVYANDVMLYDISNPTWEDGGAALAGISTGEEIATIDFDELVIYGINTQ